MSNSHDGKNYGVFIGVEGGDFVQVDKIIPIRSEYVRGAVKFIPDSEGGPMIDVTLDDGRKFTVLGEPSRELSEAIAKGSMNFRIDYEDVSDNDETASDWIAVQDDGDA